MASRAPRITVVGAGIGGLVAALSLIEAGAEVEVYESVRDVRALGVGITGCRTRTAASDPRSRCSSCTSARPTASTTSTP